MRIHILGICGTFMAGIAQLAKQNDHEVTGSDMNVYPPMSHQLISQGISLQQGYDPDYLDPNVDCVIVGNVIKRGNPLLEYVLDRNIPYISGPQWLAENILKDRWVLAVSGTHGKTTTTSMLAWILEAAGMNPGFLIGGVPENFGVSARTGSHPFFIIEADEYDCAFFDKRSKFLHYRPKTLIINNLEFDHADIFASLDEIKKQFHHLLRTVPSNGLIIRHAQDPNIEDVISKGCWSPTVTFSGAYGHWRAKLLNPDGSRFEVYTGDACIGEVSWGLLGNHNVENALAALAAAQHTGISLQRAIESLSSFKNVKRRLEVKGQVNGITLYDDFAHHPTAIATTLAGLRAKVEGARIIAVLEFGSYTMRSGIHKDNIQNALTSADMIICKRPEQVQWDINSIFQDCAKPTALFDNVDLLVENLIKELKSGDHVVVMSNSGFGGIHQKLLHALDVHFS